ncbi:DUF3995 domain-containing protein [Parasedimentitalea psychrophila]|uniref:DUF3995 domain-containing protein n=1 Tax=Parasedimentitalea psychrophila TaxID=2997337 RepID=A0A9Y2L2V8_9RHOB|nr:DUF3995 domain-containing protein [Parasedimentitalea psychrophila]WIY27009.1 DUF3995 domain-containing protein [Parasedimentitalea psychrophila]
MMPFSAILVVILLLAIALLHLLWAMGSHWPAADEATLAKTVVGSKGIKKMPPRLASLMVALVLTGAAHVVMAYAGLMQGFLLFQMYRILLVAMILVFSFRGLVAYVPQWRAMVPEQPFARFDQTRYGPLCILIAALLLDVALT